MSVFVCFQSRGGAVMSTGLTCAALCLSLLARPSAAGAQQRPVRVVLDPGHDRFESGALSARGVREVFFNDILVDLVCDHLRSTKNILVLPSRLPDEELPLRERVRHIAALRPDWVVSLHHDSVKMQFIEKWIYQGRELPYCDEFAGFSIFAQARGAHRLRSQRLARLIALGYSALGIPFTTYHAKKISGEGRKWIDAKRGIHAGDYLFLLRKLNVPVVLVESGFVINRDEEERLFDPLYVDQLAAALAQAIAMAVTE